MSGRAPAPAAGRARVATATVVLPTIGRPALVRACLESLAACDPVPDEVVVVDSSYDGAVAEVVASLSHLGVRLVPCRERGLGTAFNVGLREARHDVVLLTNDDCTVDGGWVAAGVAALAGRQDVLVTGRVRPDGDPDIVPSIIDDPVRREHVGAPRFVLYTQSMALVRSAVLEFGGFDGRISPSAEDNDLSYRWLRSGRTIVYEPSFSVRHHDWRSPEQLANLYVGYGIGQGMLYAKHLRARDPWIMRFVVRDVYAGTRGVVDRAVRGRRPHGDWRLGLVRGLPIGLARGWRAFGRHADGEKA